MGLRYVHLCHKEAGRFGPGVQLQPVRPCLFLGVELDLGDGLPDGAALSVLSVREGVEDVCLCVATALPNTTAHSSSYPRKQCSSQRHPLRLCRRGARPGQHSPRGADSRRCRRNIGSPGRGCRCLQSRLPAR